MALYPTAQLQAFVEVAAQAGFTRAAERLGVSQPTVSQLVRALERRVGTPLFARGTRRVELTAAGDAAFHRLRTIAQRFDAALRAGFTDAELDTVRALLARLRDNVAPG